MLTFKSLKISKIFLGIFVIELTGLLSFGIYHLAKNQNLLLPAFIIFVIAYIIGVARTIFSRKNARHKKKSISRRFVVGLIMLILGFGLSFLRKKILGEYFAQSQVNLLTIWFIIGMILENVIVLGFGLKQLK